MEQTQKFGIYLNASANTVVRITSPYWIPKEPEWTLLAKDPNTTLRAIRQICEDGKLVSAPNSVQWGAIPIQD